MTAPAPSRAIHRIVTPAPLTPLHSLVLNLTALILLLRPFEVWWVTPFVLLGAGLAVLFPSVRARPVTWFTLSALVALRTMAVWPLSDNHIYLLAYWCLAIGIALCSADAGWVLARASRWLLGGVFACAVLWKAVLSPDYLDGRFFRVTLMTDDRFADAVMLMTGLTADQIRDNRAALTPLPEGAELADPPVPVEPPRFRALAMGMTWCGVLLEALLGLLQLAPGGRRVERLRHLALIVFCFTTYAFAPVAGFGWLLSAMGLGQCREEQRGLRAAYVSVFFLVLLYAEIPWAGVLASWMN